MKKVALLITSCVLSCSTLLSSPNISMAESKREQIGVSKEEAKEKVVGYVNGVSKQTFQNWKNANVDQGKNLYNLEGEISGYVFQVNKDNQDLGYIIADSKKTNNSIIESTREGSSPYKEVEEGKAIYTGPLQHFKKDNDNITDIHSKQVLKIDDAKQIELKKAPISKSIAYAATSNNDMDDMMFKEKLIQNVPDYTWFRGCTPTAFANIIGYWGKLGYGNLVSNKNHNQIINQLADIMGTTPGVKHPGRVDGGATQIDRMVPGLKQYFNNTGYNPEILYDNTPTFEEYTKEIDADRPIAINIFDHPMYQNHTVTGVGYNHIYIPDINEEYKDLILHDTWEDTPVDTLLNYNASKQYIHSFISLTPFSFKDVSRSHWSYSEIAYMVQKNIMSGYGDGNFGPSDNITREQLAAVLYRQLKPADTNDNPFNDINGSWATKEIKALTKAGIFSVNSEKKFNPKNTATRAEIASVLTKAYNLKVKANYEFNDMKGHWANEYVKALYTNGIASGTGNKNFSPNANVTREQMAVFLYRAINLDPEFKPSPIN
ncbi:S-layer homology domain-containing protein [Bacillus cereus]|uniref:S-layer homology domain-containing protein n=1 Tax=Bacillus cereus TaxID=1396 RepID=UPI001F0CE775|nr:S-layer homology domain-containing protein [Bacillus cereus]MCH5477091.1 S-layer homology domain-containing protein [Bacillus cereus]